MDTYPRSTRSSNEPADQEKVKMASEPEVESEDSVVGAMSYPTSTRMDQKFSHIGLGREPDGFAVMAAFGQYYSERRACSVTLNWNDGNCQAITLVNGAQTFTFVNPRAGARYLLELKQPASGAAGTVSFPGTVKWPGGTPPVLTATNGQTDVMTFYYNGTNYVGAFALNYAL